jgi:8-oxo-dGTP pyrophosphatase MutT (NUDIX family)
MKKSYENFHVSQVAILIRDNKCLVLEFASHPGKWGLPGGRIDKNEESAESAFRREIKKELGFDNFKIEAIVDHEAWYNPAGKAVCAVARLISNNQDKISLSDEHRQYRWIEKNELEKIDFLWPNAARMCRNGFIHLNK